MKEACPSAKVLRQTWPVLVHNIGLDAFDVDDQRVVIEKVKSDK